MDSQALWEFLGKPSTKDVEAKIQYAQTLRDGAKDPLEKDRAIELAKSYIQVWQFLEDRERLAEARTIIAAVSGQISSLKKMLRKNERIYMTPTETQYQIVGQDGQALDYRSLTPLQGNKLDTVKLAYYDKEMWKLLRKELKQVKKRNERWSKISSFAIEVSRAMMDATTLVIEEGKAELAFVGKRDKDYKARAELIRKGHNTSVDNRGVFFVDGKEVPTFWGVKA